MWTLVIRKILNNKWMMLCLLFGFIIVVAMVSSVPVFNDGILQRMLIKEFEEYQLENNKYPGTYAVESNLAFTSKTSSKIKLYDYFSEKIEDEFMPDLGIDFTASAKRIVADNIVAFPEDDKYSTGKNLYMRIQTMPEFEDHINIISGRMYETEAVDGVYEVIITEKAMSDLSINLDIVYDAHYVLDDAPTIKFKVVGVFEMDDSQNPYWYNTGGIGMLGNSVMMHSDAFKDLFIEQNECREITKVYWYYGIDYYQIEIDDIESLLSKVDSHKEVYDKYKNSITLRMPSYDIMQSYNERSSQLSMTLWIILVPLLIMLAFYIFMVSQLIVKSEENEIAVMRSRGASSGQIFKLYFLEGLILSIIALIIGPPLGLMLCKILGSSNGFLEFVSRTAIPVKLDITAYLYSLIAVAVFMITMLIPAYKTSKQTVVERKRKKSRNTGKPLWQKFYLDLVLLAISIYGRLQYEDFKVLLAKTGETATTVSIDPLLFLISSMFIMGCGMLFLRLYPYIIRLIFWIGKKKWSPTLYASFIQVGRSSGQERFLMLFIILSIAIGIFNANSARTLNQNIEDKIAYTNGADIRLDVYWMSNEETIEASSSGDSSIFDGQGSSSSSEQLRYIEPPMSTYNGMEGVESMAKVYVQEKGKISASGSSVNNAMIMGIEPYDFGNTIWFRNDLLPHHINEYLNLISDAPKGVLVSSSLKEKLGLEVGDPIDISWDSQPSVECTVYAFVDYWPSYNQYRTDRNGEIVSTDCVIANLSFLQSKLRKEPYEIWIKRADGYTDTDVYNSIVESNLQLDGITYVDQEIIKSKNDPLLQGLNGMLTLSFIITMMISAIGFLIYWILSIKSRALQFGIFRAMGLSLKNIIGMIVAEQIMISIVSIVVGVLLGGITSDIFVPMMEMVYNIAEQIPPFRVVASREDYYKIYFIIGIMLIIGTITITRIIAKIKITQALKLGED